MTDRRSFLLGFGAILAAPAVVRAESLMRVAALRSSVLPVFIVMGAVPHGAQYFFRNTAEGDVWVSLLESPKPIRMTPGESLLVIAGAGPTGIMRLA